jgi:hypothetical protein
MATTTNYGWETPDDTDLVKDGAAAIRTLGSSIDTTTKNLNPETTLGDLAYRSATANTNTRLAIGSTGNVLTVSGGVPVWAAPAGGGKVLQVIQTVKTDTFSSTSTSYTDITGLSASITPASASNKVLVLVTVQGMGRENVMGLQLVRGATAIGGGTAAGSRLSAFAANKIADFDSQFTMATNYLDSPATTSSTTYKVQFVINAGTGFINRSSNDTDAAYSYRTASTITLLEIGA